MIGPLSKRKGIFMELRVDNQLDEKTETLIRNIIGASIDVHRELGPGLPRKSLRTGNGA